ncbi:hypothetical protein HRG_006488 [Hirsutella rhossiliensis]|uniref:Uncharacterized protein n=1 Tax=Hirsutella rhossiliensis TaxID=111463 RepID=A0A9P8SH15_9HYPO|nr:uncharacterized protein HRG_06488 [Hirsutella rhossiliensis]KAH0962386.1 hypothetical protein HRG_06488 [Hirsutella rhossiliensis]
MASLQLRPTTLGQRGGGSAKLTKPRGRIVVKPLLKKLHSHSDRESLDLDRGWDDQPSLERLHHGSYDTPPVSPHYTCYASPSSARSPRDVSFSLSPSDFGAGGGRPHNFSHARSASAASHASIATTNSGGGRNGGSFIHPFQQTPQTSLSYAHSRASLDVVARDCSPTITEDDGDFDPNASFHSVSTSAARPPAHHLQQQPRRSSLASQPASSLSDGIHALHVVASRSLSGSVQRLASSSANQSRSELQLSAGASLVDSPLSTTAPPATAISSPQSTTAAPSCSSSTGPMSPIRSSLDMAGFRLRSRSELDAVSRQDHVREARRKFEAKERAKEERYAREQVRKRERACSKEAQKLEREQARLHRTSQASLSGRPTSSGPRRRVVAGGIGLGLVEADEKSACSGRADDSPSLGQAPRARADNVEFKSSKRTKTAKHRTVGVWTAFMLWLRTRLLKLGRR